jgi:hypothetical protein
MVIVRLVVFMLGAIALAGCCMSGSGCYVATDGPLSAWDGRGTGPDDKPPPQEEAMTPEPSMPPARQSKTRMSQSKMDMTIGPITRTRGEARSEGKSRSDQDYAEQQAADQEADAALARKLIICRDCAPSARDNAAAAAGSVMR